LPPDDAKKPGNNWVAGDKTGTSLWPGMGGLYVDIGFVEPPETPPITFATYYRSARYSDGIDPAAERALARVGDLIATYGGQRGWFPF
jgi:beta-lactamase class A